MRRRPPPLRRAHLAVLVALAALGVACSDGDDEGASGSTPVDEPQAASGDSADATTTSQVLTADAGTTQPADVADGGDVATAPTVVASTTIDPAVTEPTGVPGLDAELEVCRQWSRFAGSFQVVAVASSFVGPEDGAELEVLAAATVTEAYDSMLAAWPDELADERDVVAEEFLGPFARRAQVARSVLVEAGLDDDDLVVLGDAWLDALAARDPSSPTLAVDVAPELAEAVEEAVGEFGTRLVPVPEDPALVTNAAVPQTEAFLAERCPDEGALGGGDAVG